MALAEFPYTQNGQGLPDTTLWPNGSFWNKGGSIGPERPPCPTLAKVSAYQEDSKAVITAAILTESSLDNDMEEAQLALELWHHWILRKDSVI